MINLGVTSVDSIDWNQPHIEILLNEWFNVQLPYLESLKRLFLKHKNTQIVLKSGAGPFAQIFDDCDNVKIEMSYPHFPAHLLYQAFSKIDLQKKLFHDQKFYHTVSTFNGTFHSSRMLLVLYLFTSNLWNEKYCFKSKKLSCNIKTLQQWKNKGIENILKNTPLKAVKKFLESYNEIDYQRWDHVKNCITQSPIMKKTLVHLISETYAEGTQPFFTEKTFLSIVNKSIFLTLGQPNYYSVLNKSFGFKNFNCFDYSFDHEPDLLKRIESIVDQIKKLSHLSDSDKMELYHSNKPILDWNFNHFISGDWMKQCTETINQLDKIIPIVYSK